MGQSPLQIDDAVMLLADQQFTLRAQHALAFLAADHALFQRDAGARNVAPGSAIMPFMPVRAFGAPHTT